MPFTRLKKPPKSLRVNQSTTDYGEYNRIQCPNANFAVSGEIPIFIVSPHVHVIDFGILVLIFHESPSQESPSLIGRRSYIVHCASQHEFLRRSVIEHPVSMPALDGGSHRVGFRLCVIPIQYQPESASLLYPKSGYRRESNQVPALWQRFACGIVGQRVWGHSRCLRKQVHWEACSLPGIETSRLDGTGIHAHRHSGVPNNFLVRTHHLADHFHCRCTRRRLLHRKG